MTGMQNHRLPILPISLALMLLAAATPAARAQSSTNNPFTDPTQINERFPDHTVTVDKQEVTQDMRRARLINTARQRAIVSDAAKLLALARLLNAGVDAHGTQLTAAQRMKLAAGIEKLAHSVKERMTYSVSNTITPPSIFQSWQ